MDSDNWFVEETAKAFCAPSRTEKTPSLLQSSSDGPGPARHLVGFCTGLLPAAVAAASTSLADATRLSQEIVLLSIRLGLHAYRRSVAIEATSGVWSVVVLGQDATQLRSKIDAFHQDQASFPRH